MVKRNNKSKENGESRIYMKSNHYDDCPNPGHRSHSGKCADQPKAEKSESVRTQRSGNRTESDNNRTESEGNKTGRGNSTKTRRTRKSSERESKAIALGDLNNQPNDAFIYEIDEALKIVGFDGDVVTNQNYGKFSYADEASYEDGDLVLHRREFMDFQVHNVGLGGLEDGDSVTVLIIPNVKLDWNEITLGDIFNTKNHMR